MNNNQTKKMMLIGAKLTIGLTLPVCLIFLGFLTFPIGIFFWGVAILIFVMVFRPTTEAEKNIINNLKKDAQNK